MLPIYIIITLVFNTFKQIFMMIWKSVDKFESVVYYKLRLAYANFEHLLFIYNPPDALGRQKNPAKLAIANFAW